MKTYFVTFRLFNADNKGWAYKEEKFDSEDVAVQKYGEYIKTYYQKAPFVFGLIKVEDEVGNRLEIIKWGELPTPEEKVEPAKEAV